MADITLNEEVWRETLDRLHLELLEAVVAALDEAADAVRGAAYAVRVGEDAS
jgi:hypothetical protein